MTFKLKTAFACAWLFAGIVTSGNAQPADAFGDLAKAIVNNFPLSKITPEAGSDWCHNIQLDDSLHNWAMNMKYDKNLQHPSEQNKLISLTGKDNKGNFTNFHSLILGIDFGNSSTYYLHNEIAFPEKFEEAQKQATQRQQSQKAALTSTPVINIPKCDSGEFKDLLMRMFKGAAQRWVPVNPLCYYPVEETDPGDGKTPKCQYAKGHWEKQKSQSYGVIDKDVPRSTWRFNYEERDIVGVLRFWIKLCPADAGSDSDTVPACDPNDNAAADGYLNVGYSGSGGAG